MDELKTTVGIMQPYFFPYIGYFQLINAVDVWVNLDHVSFMKRSYMTRNTLKNDVNINIPVIGGSQNKSCREVMIAADLKWFDKFSKTIEQLYKKEKNYQIILEEILIPWNSYFLHNEKRKLSISESNFIIIYYICQYLNINCRFYSSYGDTTRKRNEGIQDIVKVHKGTHYINAIGGQSLYSKEDFASQGIDITFIQNKSEIGNTSILDILFRFDKEYIKQELNNYILI